MSSIDTRPLSGGRSSFSAVLRPFRRRWLLIASTRMLLWAFATVVVIWLIAMWIDLVWALPHEIRWWVSRIAAPATFAISGAFLLTRLFFNNDERLAAQIDHAKKTGGEIHAGFQLESHPAERNNTLTQGFASLAIERSRRLADSIAEGEVFRSETLRRPSIVLSLILAAVLFISMIVPGIAKNQVWRLLSPTSDVPPYTGLTIELQFDQNSVLYGDNLLVHATGSGARVDRMQLVTRTEQGDENVLPMLPDMVGNNRRFETQWQAMLSNVTEPLTLYARSGRSRSRYHQLGVTMTPQLLPPTVRITPPEYTRSGTYEGPIPDSGVEGLAGTEVVWRLSSNRPLESGTVAIKYRDGVTDLIRLQPNSEHADDFVSRRTDPESTTVYGAMSLTRPGQFTLSVTDVDGIESRETIRGNITLLKDQRPVVRITSPRPISLAIPDIRIPVAIEGADDYGISKMSLYRSLNGSPASKMDLDTDGTRQQLVRWELPLDRYGVTPGDEIQLFARIEDNDPEGAKGDESPVTIVRIITRQKFDELSLQRRGVESLQAKYAASQRHLENLAEALRAVDEAAKEAAKSNTTEARKALQEKLAAAEQAAEAAAEAMEKFSQEAMPIDVDRELAERLGKQAKQIQEIAKQLQGLGAKNPESQRPLTESQTEALQKMAEQVASERHEIQKNSVQPLELLQQVMPLIADQQRFERIVRQQRDLERRLNSLNAAETPDQIRVAELESQQQQLRQALDQLLDDIEMHAQSLDENPDVENLRQTALEFVDAVRKSEAESKMISAQKGLLNSEFDSAHKDARSAADILESFLNQCQGMGNKACESCKMGFNPGSGGANLGNSIEQLLAMMGMKPGSSGMTPGGSPGLGNGWGAGGGYAQRNPGPNNVGMYGTMPSQAQSNSLGTSDRSSSGIASIRSGSPGMGQPSDFETAPSDAGGGQTQQAIPGKYREKVSEYFRQLTEQLGE